jgi:hypothetical protein
MRTNGVLEYWSGAVLQQPAEAPLAPHHSLTLSLHHSTAC